MGQPAQKRRVWQCPQCRKRFKIPVERATPNACPSCAAFEEIVEEAVAKPQQETADGRWSLFRRRKKKQATATIDRQEDAEKPVAETARSAFPQCRKCGGPLESLPMKRHTVIRWCRELMHVSIGLAAFPFVPPYGLGIGITYILIMLYVEKNTPPKRYLKCQHCRRKIRKT